MTQDALCALVYGYHTAKDIPEPVVFKSVDAAKEAAVAILAELNGGMSISIVWKQAGQHWSYDDGTMFFHIYLC